MPSQENDNSSPIQESEQPLPAIPPTGLDADSNEELPAIVENVCTAPGGVTVQEVTTPGGAQVMRAVMTEIHKLWPNGSTITCTFVQPHAGTAIQQAKVKTIVQLWERYANLKLEFVHGPHAMVRIGFDPKDGNWSYVGQGVTRHTTGPTMNLASVKSSEGIRDGDRRAILHEFGHTLGMEHEHQSPRRSEKITLDEAAVIKDFQRTNGWSEEKIRHNVLNPLKVELTSSFSAFDFKSIMLYSMSSTLNKQRIEIKWNTRLSQLDKAFIMINYPCFGTSPSGWTIQDALDVSGVHGESKSHILQAYHRKDWAGMRTSFINWSRHERTIHSRRRGLKTDGTGGDLEDDDDTVEDDDSDNNSTTRA